MSKKQKSVLAADRQKKNSTTAAAVSTGGYLQKEAGGEQYHHGSWSTPVSQPEETAVRPKAMKEQPQTNAVDPFDIPDSEEPDTAKKRAAYEARQAELKAYRGIIREAYEDYRRNQQLFPEYMMQMDSGHYDELLTRNDLVFQEYVKEMAEEMGKKNKKLEKQLEALTKMAELPDQQ